MLQHLGEEACFVSKRRFKHVCGIDVYGMQIAAESLSPCLTKHEATNAPVCMSRTSAQSMSQNIGSAAWFVLETGAKISSKMDPGIKATKCEGALCYLIVCGPDSVSICGPIFGCSIYFRGNHS